MYLFLFTSIYDFMICVLYIYFIMILSIAITKREYIFDLATDTNTKLLLLLLLVAVLHYAPTPMSTQRSVLGKTPELKTTAIYPWLFTSIVYIFRLKVFQFFHYFFRFS